MTPAQLAFWQRAHRRAALLTPELAKAMLTAFAMIRETLPETQLARIVASGDVNELIRVALTDEMLNRAFLPVRERIRSSVAGNLRYFARDLPKAGRVDGQVAVGFDILNPRVIDAVRALDTKVIDGLKGDVRETVRAFTENGLRDGVGPRTLAREIREVVGLAPKDERAVANFRKLLESGDRDALQRVLRDKRFDRTLENALGKDGKGLAPETIDKMVDSYRRRTLANTASTNARSAANDSLKLGQRLSWEDAAEKGIVDRARLVKRWVTNLDGRERPEHRSMNGQVVHFDAPFLNGQMVPGESDYNCRCVAMYSQAAKSA